jgi:ATP-binding cassette, subfamily B, multidrug efflux pump
MTDLHQREKNRGKGHDWQLTARLVRYLYPYKWSIFLSSALTILNAPLATVGPLLTKAAIDLYLAPDPSRPLAGYVVWVKNGADWAGMGGSRHQGLAFMAILFLLSNLAQSATQYLQVVITENAGQKAIHDLREALFRHLQKIPIAFYDRNPVGKLMTRLTSDVDSLNEMFSSGIVTVLSQGAVALYIAIWMIWISRSLALVSCATLLAIAAFTIWFRRIARPVFRHFREQLTLLNVFLQEHLTGMQVIQIFTREARELEKCERINHDYWKAATAATARNALLYPAIETMAMTGIALMIWHGGGQVMNGIISLGTLVAFIQLAQSFYDPVTEISSRSHILQAALTASERIFHLLDEPVGIVPPEKPVQLSSVRGRIEFRNVWFAYRDDAWVLKNISFVVEPGEKIGFVGQTGAGKTTITNLLLRFYEIQAGQILLDDVDIRQISIAELRSRFSIVPQDIFLFSSDIASNIRMGDQSISEEQVRTAAKKVCLNEFIGKLANGYRSELLERGANLSMGQKQLVGFARALAFDRPILILDEATSSIDAQTESQISKVIPRIMAGRTALVIAHRLSTIQAVDRIIVMHQGEICESGDHRSLLKQRGFYWRLHQLHEHRQSTGKIVEIADAGGSRLQEI